METLKQENFLCWMLEKKGAIDYIDPKSIQTSAQKPKNFEQN